MITKHMAVRLLFVAEIIFFVGAYVFGAHGVRARNKLDAQIRAVEDKNNVLKLEIAGLKKELDSWQTDPFYKEQLARERLHLFKQGEEIFLYAKEM